MSHHTFGGTRHAFRLLAGLDFGLRARVELHPCQRTIFSGAKDFSVQDLTCKLAQMISSLHVHSYSVRGQLEQITTALQLNVESGFWPLARRAALDLAGVLTLARKRRLADGELCSRGASTALRIAALCSAEVR